MQPIISVAKLSKTYDSGFVALKDVDLEIRRGEILALLGPNGAGKTTLISIICGIVNPTSGAVRVDGHDVVSGYRAARSKIEAPSPAHIEKLLRQLSLWDKKDSKIMDLSGGMKRRVMIAKALSHEPVILFLDEPTAGVDVELRRDMWEMVRGLRESGVTIILTTHYIEEAEEMADRIGVISKGEIILVEDKDRLMHKLGKKQLTLHLQSPLAGIPEDLRAHPIELSEDGNELVYTFDAQGEHTGIAGLLRKLNEHGVHFKDIQSSQSSLEEIFVNLVNEER